MNTAEDYARERLSEKRHAHTLRVAETAERLADLHGIDPDKARLAALLHDSAREVGKEELLRITGEEGITIGEFERERPILLHGPVAAALARRDLGLEDEEIFRAVRDHTLGESGMSPLALALYVADKIEPNRDQPGVKRLRELAYESLPRAAAASLRDSISYNEQHGRPSHPKSLRALRWLEDAGRPGEIEV